MITWLALIGAAVPLGTACWWMARRRPTDDRRDDDPDWGDWPRDQRMP